MKHKETSVIHRERGWAIFSGKVMVFPTLMPTKRDCLFGYLEGRAALPENHTVRRVTVEWEEK